MDDSVPPNKESAAETESWSDQHHEELFLDPFLLGKIQDSEKQGLPVFRHKSLCKRDKNVNTKIV